MAAFPQLFPHLQRPLRAIFSRRHKKQVMRSESVNNRGFTVRVFDDGIGVDFKRDAVTPRDFFFQKLRVLRNILCEEKLVVDVDGAIRCSGEDKARYESLL